MFWQKCIKIERNMSWIHHCIMKGETNDSIAVTVNTILHTVVFYSVMGTEYSSKKLCKDDHFGNSEKSHKRGKNKAPVWYQQRRAYALVLSWDIIYGVVLNVQL